MPKKKQPDFIFSEATAYSTALALFASNPRISSSSGGLTSDIDVQLEQTGTWATVATVESVNGIDATDMADFIIKAVQHYSKHLSDNKRGASAK
jgi:hypothetical protein